MNMKKLLQSVVVFFIAIISLMNPVCFASNELEDLAVDVVYKYIDLTDKNLIREGIPQITKDYDNEELRYSLRSVLQNIPWVRKIFIIMPNEQVSFLKDVKELDDKIVYIRDKDLIGFDSASCVPFEFNLWRLKYFGCSEHFIYMNDDCFIGQPMTKSEFFYTEGDKIVPWIQYAKGVSYGQYNSIKLYYEKLKQLINAGIPELIRALGSDIKKFQV